jgi:hypothetical protein
MLAKFVKFFSLLRKSPSIEVSLIANIVGRDIRTTTGSNLALVREVTVLDPWSCSSGQVRKVLGEVESEVPAQDHWIIAYLEKLLARGVNGITSSMTHQSSLSSLTHCMCTDMEDY